jgi:diadenosine tetraphosphate (Ap4A) HIT family hydrolase
MSNECPFCQEAQPLLDNNLAFVRRDKFPVSEGHLLVCTKRHVASFFDATKDEICAVHELILEAQSLMGKISKPNGYNIGINVGEAAGQTVMHLHVHIIPRYLGDVLDPRGGVRGVIPSKQKY